MKHHCCFTFKCFCGTRCVVFVWVKFEGQLSVRLFEVLFRCVFFNSQNLVVVFTAFNPEANKYDWFIKIKYREILWLQ